MPRRGLEPPCPCGRYHLKVVRLPISPPGLRPCRFGRCRFGRATGGANIAGVRAARRLRLAAIGQTMTAPVPSLDQLFESAAARARAENAFGPIFVHENALNCEAKASASEAYYRLSFDGGKLWAGLVTS